MLFLFFSKFCTSKSGVRLIYGCGLYTDVYGIFLQQKSRSNCPWRTQQPLNTSTRKCKGPFYRKPWRSLKTVVQSGCAFQSSLEWELIKNSKVHSGHLYWGSLTYLERKSGNMPIKNEHVYGQSIFTLVSKDKAGLVEWANVWNLQQPQLINEIKAVATSHESFVINKETSPHLFAHF